LRRGLVFAPRFAATRAAGTNRVNAMAATQEAWWIACQQAVAVGMLAPARRG
jgi:hypothetical protein